MRGVDMGIIQESKLTITEIDEKADDRIEYYLNLLEAQGFIMDLDTSTSNQGTIFTFSYKGKKITVVFELNNGHTLWASDDSIAKSDLIIFHDSITNNPTTPKYQHANKFINHALKLIKPQERDFFLLTENEWEKDCPESKNQCKIEGENFAIEHYQGFYGCGMLSQNNPSFSVLNGGLIQDQNSTYQRKHHIHPGPASYTGPGVLLQFKPSY